MIWNSYVSISQRTVHINVSTFLSVLAIVLSAMSIILTYRQNSKMQEINLKSSFYHSIFDTYLMKKIPDAYELIHLNHESGLVENGETLLEVLDEMVRNARFFKHENREFYSKLRTTVYEIDSFVSKRANNKINENEFACWVDPLLNNIHSLYIDIENSMTKGR